MAASPLPWLQPGLRSRGVAVTMGPFLFLSTCLSALRANFDQSWPVWLYTSRAAWVISWAVRCMRSLKHRCFFSEKTSLDGCWGGQQIHWDWPLRCFLNTECFICLLLWSYCAASGIFSCTTAILHFEETTTAWINVTLLGLSFIVSKSPLKSEVVIHINHTYVSFVVPLHSQRAIKMCMNSRPPV